MSDLGLESLDIGGALPPPPPPPPPPPLPPPPVMPSLEESLGATDDLLSTVLLHATFDSLCALRFTSLRFLGLARQALRSAEWRHRSPRNACDLTAARWEGGGWALKELTGGPQVETTIFLDCPNEHTAEAAQDAGAMWLPAVNGGGGVLTVTLRHPPNFEITPNLL
eukprot:7351697-Prymnesium_polylepis.1